MISLSGKMECAYGHLFDTTIVNDDIETAFSELCFTASNVETQPHWVPASWIA